MAGGWGYVGVGEERGWRRESDRMAGGCGWGLDYWGGVYTLGGWVERWVCVCWGEGGGRLREGLEGVLGSNTAPPLSPLTHSDGFQLFFMLTGNGQVYARVSRILTCRRRTPLTSHQSDQFSIVAQTPSNYTSAGESSPLLFFASWPALPLFPRTRLTPDLPTATVTATLDATPNPTQQWAVTLDGNDPIATTSAQAIAGNAGSGGGV